LIGVAHHSDQQVDQDDDRHQHVDAKDGLKQINGPRRLVGVCGLPQFGRRRHAEHGEKQQLKRVDWAHQD